MASASSASGRAAWTPKGQKADDLDTLRSQLGPHIRHGVAMALLHRQKPSYLERNLAYRLASARSRGWRVRSAQSRAICSSHLTLDGLKSSDFRGQRPSPNGVTLAILIAGCPVASQAHQFAPRRIAVYQINAETDRLHCSIRHSVPDMWDRSLRVHLAVLQLGLPLPATGTTAERPGSLLTKSAKPDSGAQCAATLFVAELRALLWQLFGDPGSSHVTASTTLDKHVTCPSDGISLLQQCAPQFRATNTPSSPVVITTDRWNETLLNAARMAISSTPGANFTLRTGSMAHCVRVPSSVRCQRANCSVYWPEETSETSCVFNTMPCSHLRLDLTMTSSASSSASSSSSSSASSSSSSSASSFGIRFERCIIDSALKSEDNEQTLALHSVVGRDAYGLPRRRDGVLCGVTHRLPPLQPLPDVRWVWRFRAGTAEKRQVVLGPSCAVCGVWCGSAVGLHCHCLSSHPGLNVEVQLRSAPLAQDLQSASGLIQVQQVVVTLCTAVDPHSTTSKAPAAAVSSTLQLASSDASKTGLSQEHSTLDKSHSVEDSDADAAAASDAESETSNRRQASRSNTKGSSKTRPRRHVTRRVAAEGAALTRKERRGEAERAKARQIRQGVSQGLQGVVAANRFAPDQLGVLPSAPVEATGVDTGGAYDARVVTLPAFRPRFMPATAASETAADMVQLSAPGTGAGSSSALPDRQEAKLRVIQIKARRMTRMAEAESLLEIWDHASIQRLLVAPAWHSEPVTRTSSAPASEISTPSDLISASDRSDIDALPPSSLDMSDFDDEPEDGVSATLRDHVIPVSARELLSASIGSTAAVRLHYVDPKGALRPQTLHPLVAWLAEGDETARSSNNPSAAAAASGQHDLILGRPASSTGEVAGLPALSIGGSSSSSSLASARGTGRGKSRGKTTARSRGKSRSSGSGDLLSGLLSVPQAEVPGLFSGAAGGGVASSGGRGWGWGASVASPLAVAAALAAQDAGPNAMLVRPYFHSRTNMPLVPGEYDEDSDDDTNDAWTSHRSRSAIARFGDVRPAEREFMLLWNEFATRFRILTIGTSQRAVLAFARAHGLTIVERGLRGCFVVHLITMWDRGLIESVAMSLALQIVDSYVQTAHRLVRFARDFWTGTEEPKRQKRASRTSI